MRSKPVPPGPSLTVALAALAGLLMAGAAFPKLAKDPRFGAAPNPLGINRSPYGEVLAMAAQGPIDTWFHEGETHDHSHHECTEDHVHGEDCSHGHDERGHDDHACTEDHQHDEHCVHGHGSHDAADDHEPAPPARQNSRTLTEWLRQLKQATRTRTNPKPLTAAHKLHIHRTLESKIRFAYQLDPSHYANYNNYHLFLTEGATQYADRPHRPGQLAADTINYCLTRQDDPRPALTAASAAGNVLEILITSSRVSPAPPPRSQIEQALLLMDQCLHRHRILAARWDSDGSWARLSEFRIREIRERFRFLTKVRESAGEALKRLDEPKPPTPLPTANPKP